MMAIAPELDRRYERLYTDIQNHLWLAVLANVAKPSRKPSVALALNLRCSKLIALLNSATLQRHHR